jgi:U3 small nucleolar RNA-associated protein MPP10
MTKGMPLMQMVTVFKNSFITHTEINWQCSTTTEIFYADFFDPPAKKPMLPWRKKVEEKQNRDVRFNDRVASRKFSKDRPPSDVNLASGVDELDEEDQLKDDAGSENDDIFGSDFNEDEDDQDGEEDVSEEEEDGDSQPAKKRSNSLFDDDDDEASEGQILSRHEKEQLRLKQQIEALEAEAVAAKTWTLKGEVGSKARPTNSLLEEDLDVEHASRPVPVVTEETTQSLEELIKSRIADELFDDVVRKVDPKPRNFDPNRGNAIDESKSSKSLSEIYENEYLRQTTGGEARQTEKEQALQKSHQEIEGLLKELWNGLDALSNFHYKPEGPVAELEVVAAPSVPALTVEEVIPSVISDAAMATAKEVYDGIVKKGDAEMDSKDKRKARLQHKRKVGKEKKERDLERKAKEMLASGGAAGGSGSNIVDGKRVDTSKTKALTHLMKQSNVTIVAGGSSQVKQIAEMKGKGKKGKQIKAHVLERGGKIGEKNGPGNGSTASQLRL